EVWEPRDTFGAELVNEPGAWTWNELASPDLDASTAFYGDLFGWEMAQFEQATDPYLVISNKGSGNGGVRPPQPGEPPYWLVYFGTDDVEAALPKVEELGGKMLAGPVDIQIAKIGIAADPQGAVFALYAGEMQP